MYYRNQVRLKICRTTNERDNLGATVLYNKADLQSRCMKQSGKQYVPRSMSHAVCSPSKRVYPGSMKQTLIT